MTDFEIKVCTDRAGLSAKTKRKVALDLNRLENRELQFEIILKTPIVWVIKSEGVEAVVHEYGEILFKKLKDNLLDRKKAIELAEKVYGTMES